MGHKETLLKRESELEIIIARQQTSFSVKSVVGQGFLTKMP